MNLHPGTHTLLVALTVAGSALVAPAMALAETPAPEGPIGPVDVANPIDEPEPEPCDDPGDCLTNPTEPEPCDDPGDCLTNPTDDSDDGGDDGDPGDGQDDGEGPHVTPPSDVDAPILASPTFTG
jgi:hypothetical protein